MKSVRRRRRRRRHRRRRRRRRRHCHERRHERRRQVHRRMRQHKRRHRLDQHKRRPHLLPRPAAVRRPRPHRPSPQLGLVPTAHPRPHRPIRAERAVDETTVNVNVNGIERTGARSEVISGAQRISSEAITPAGSRGNQRQSEAITPAGSRASKADRAWAR